MTIDYEKLYHLMFNRVTDALRELERGRVDTAKGLLVSAQQAAEEQYIESQE